MVRTDAEKAEELSRRRSRILPVLAAIFLAQQATFFSRASDASRPVDQLHISAWLVLSIVLVLALATGGGWIYSRKVRQLANDESTQAHRADALKTGFLIAMAACVAAYALTMFEPMSAREAIHLIMTCGIASALLRFGYLERRALRNG